MTGSYDCVDRIVLNAFFPLGHNPGGFRTWWRRWHGDSDAELDNTHLMRMAGRFARRVKAWGAANAVPVIFCKAGDRKHRIAEAYLASHEVGIGVFLVLVAKAPVPVWKVARSAKTGAIVNIQRRREYVNHYSFHIMDPTWGHVTIKMSGHPPFGAQIVLNGHEFVARQAAAAGIAFSKVGNCFTAVADPVGLDRRCLVAGCGCRAAGSGLPTLDLHRVPVFRARSRRATPQRIRLRVRGLSARVQSQPDLRRRREDAAALRHRGGSDPLPAGRAQDPHRLRHRAAAPPHPHAFLGHRGRDRDTYV